MEPALQNSMPIYSSPSSHDPKKKWKSPQETACLRSTLVLNCDYSSKINEINYLSWPSRTWCWPIKEQTGLEHLSAFLFTSHLPANGFETAILELDWLISIGRKQRWKIMPKDLPVHERDLYLYSRTMFLLSSEGPKRVILFSRAEKWQFSWTQLRYLKYWSCWKEFHWLGKTREHKAFTVYITVLEAY